MNGDAKIWLRLPASTLALVDQLKGHQNRSEALRVVIERGLADLSLADMPAATDDGVIHGVAKEEAWAVEMAAWFLVTAASTWKAVGGTDGPMRWTVDVPIANAREWSAWAGELQKLHGRLGGSKP